MPCSLSQDRFSPAANCRYASAHWRGQWSSVAVEAGRAEPVLPGQLERVVHPQPALLRGVDQEQPAERPPGLAAEGRLGLLLEQDHPLAGVGQLGGGHQPGQTGPHDDDVGLAAFSVLTVATLAGRPGAPSPRGATRPARAGSTRAPAGGVARTRRAQRPDQQSTADHSARRRPRAAKMHGEDAAAPTSGSDGRAGQQHPGARPCRAGPAATATTATTATTTGTTRYQSSPGAGSHSQVAR